MKFPMKNQLVADRQLKVNGRGSYTTGILQWSDFFLVPTVLMTFQSFKGPPAFSWIIAFWLFETREEYLSFVFKKK